MVNLMIIFFSFFLLPSQHTHDLEVTISGVEEVQGSMMIAIYQPGQEFLGEEAFLFRKIPVEKSGVLTFSVLLPQGTYAISVYHDLNADGELNTNFVGIPKEPYGFSISRGSFGPPSFKEASFQVPATRHITIEVK